MSQHKSKDQLLYELELIKSELEEVKIQLENEKKEKKRIEHSLHDIEEKFRVLIKNSPNDILTVDRKGKILFLNRVTPPMKVEDAIGKNIFDIFQPKSIRTMKTALEYVFSEKKSIILDNIQIRKLHLLAHLSPIKTTGEIEQAMIILIDASEIKKADDRLRESEERYRILFNSAPIGILLSKQGNVIYSNQYQNKMYGYQSAEEMFGMNVSNLVSEEYRDRQIQRRLDREAGKKIPNNYYLEAKRKNGSTFPIQVYVAKIDLPDGPAIISFVQDITERRRTEKALKKNEAKYRALVENSPNIIQIINKHGIIKYSNFIQPDQTMKDVVETSIYSAFDEENAKVVKNSINMTFSSNKEINVEFGSLRGFYYYAQFVPLNADELMVIAVNISAMKKTEEDLRQSEARYRILVENAPESILLINWSTGKFIDANQNAELLLQLTKSELLKIGPVEVTPEYQPSGRKSIETIVDVMSQAVSGEKPVFELMVKDKNGNIFPCEIRLVKFPSSGDILVRASITDITERKNSEATLRKTREQLFQAQKMESIGRIAGGIAHDFNNMLTIVQSHCEFILAQMSTTDPIYMDIQNIITATEIASNLTKQLLKFSRKQHLKPEEVNINTTVQTMCGMVEKILPKNIKLELNLDENLKMVNIDPSQIGQVLMNLMINAIDAMPEGGKLTIKTQKMVDVCILSVSDTGIGMDEKTKNHIFEPFFTTKAEKGTGLGLATSYGIIQQSGGIIEVKTSLGKGSTFDISFPFITN